MRSGWPNAARRLVDARAPDFSAPGGAGMKAILKVHCGAIAVRSGKRRIGVPKEPPLGAGWRDHASPSFTARRCSSGLAVAAGVPRTTGRTVAITTCVEALCAERSRTNTIHVSYDGGRVLQVVGARSDDEDVGCEREGPGDPRQGAGRGFPAASLVRSPEVGGADGMRSGSHPAKCRAGSGGSMA